MIIIIIIIIIIIYIAQHHVCGMSRFDNDFYNFLHQIKLYISIVWTQNG